MWPVAHLPHPPSLHPTNPPSQAGAEDVVALGPELDHYIQGKDQYECTPLHVAIIRGAMQLPPHGPQRVHPDNAVERSSLTGITPPMPHSSFTACVALPA